VTVIRVSNQSRTEKVIVCLLLMPFNPQGIRFQLKCGC